MAKLFMCTLGQSVSPLPLRLAKIQINTEINYSLMSDDGNSITNSSRTGIFDFQKHDTCQEIKHSMSENSHFSLLSMFLKLRSITCLNTDPKPRLKQATAASVSSKSSSHTVPHTSW